jgi:hypothetical protein
VGPGAVLDAVVKRKIPSFYIPTMYNYECLNHVLCADENI